MRKLHSFLHRQTCKHMKARVSEHLGVSPRTRKPVKGTLSTSVRDRMLISDHQGAWEDSRILESQSNKFILEWKEKFFIKRYKPTLNRNHTLRNCNNFSQSFWIISHYMFLYFTKKHMIFDKIDDFSYYYHGVNLKMEVLPSECLFSWKNILLRYVKLT